MGQTHSGFGIASFVASIVSGVGLFLIIVIAGVMEMSTSGGMDEESPAMVMVGLGVLAFLFIALVAFGLGIGGTIQKDRKRILAILGTVFSALSVLGTLSLILIGLATD